MKSNYIFFVLYLFSYCQLSPAIEYSVAKEIETNKTSLTTSPSQHHREKRWFFSFVIAIAAGIISGTVSRLLGDQITKLINGKRLRRATDHIGLIAQRLNTNYDNAMALKRKVTSLNASVGNAIMVSRQGFNCDAGFCNGKSKGHYAMGLCSKYMCYCDNGRPGPLECGGGLVFDPVGRNCNYPRNMPICGY